MYTNTTEESFKAVISITINLRRRRGIDVRSKIVFNVFIIFVIEDIYYVKLLYLR